MTTTTATATTQVHRVYIKVTPEAIWDAITQPEWTSRYGYGGYTEYDLSPGGRFLSVADENMKAAGFDGVMVDGEVIEADPPNRLVQTWRMAMATELEPEGFTRLTYEIDTIDGGYSRLTVIHDLEGAPGHAAMVGGDMGEIGQGGGGWPWVLSDLKTLLETGSALTR